MFCTKQLTMNLSKNQFSLKRRKKKITNFLNCSHSILTFLLSTIALKLIKLHLKAFVSAKARAACYEMLNVK